MSLCLKPLCLGLALAFVPLAQAQVTYVQKVPTVEELQEMLKQPEAPKVPASRSLVRPGAAASAPLATGDESASVAPARAQQTPSGEPAARGPAVAMPISFELNSSRLSEISLGYVEIIAKLLARDPKMQLAVEGHTDALGSPQKNLVLSWDRALTVYKVLVERFGVDPQRLHPLGRGSLEPLEGMMPVAPMNRRVQFRRVG